MTIAPGATNVSVLIDVQDSRSVIGAGLTGLVYNSASLTCYYARPGEAAVQVPLVTLAAVDSAHSDGGFKQVDATNAPGLYRLDLPDAAAATGAGEVVVYLQGAANMVRARRSFDLRLVPLVSQEVRDAMKLAPTAGAAADGSVDDMLSDAVTATDAHYARAFLVNKRTIASATGVVTVYDDDGTTPLFTLAPSEAAGVVTLTPDMTP